MCKEYHNSLDAPIQYAFMGNKINPIIIALKVTLEELLCFSRISSRFTFHVSLHRVNEWKVGIITVSREDAFREFGGLHNGVGEPRSVHGKVVQARLTPCYPHHQENV